MIMAMELVLFFALVPGFHSPFCDSHRPPTSGGIKAVDFCNFEYPEAKPISNGSELPMSFLSGCKLHKGKRPPEGEEDGNGLVTLETIRYDRATQDGQREALVTLIWHSGGTMQLALVYSWIWKSGKSALLGSFVAGDRGFAGLRGVYGKGGDLVVELDDPDAAQASCCSGQIIRMRYPWDGNRLVPRGAREVLPHPAYKVGPAPGSRSD
jgi:hypothetical protein